MTLRFLVAYTNKEGATVIRAIESTRISMAIDTVDRGEVFMKKSFSEVSDEKLVFYRFKEDAPDNIIMSLSDLGDEYVIARMTGVNYPTTFTKWWELIEHAVDDIDANIRLCARLNEIFNMVPIPPINKGRYGIVYINEDGLKCLRIVDAECMSFEVTEKVVPTIFQAGIYGLLDENNVAVHRVKPGPPDAILASDIYQSAQIIPLTNIEKEVPGSTWEFLKEVGNDFQKMKDLYIWLEENTALLGLGS